MNALDSSVLVAALAPDEARHAQCLALLSAWAGNQPSAKVRAVLEEIMRDRSKIQEIAARLQAEDPELFLELVQFIQSQQGG